MSDGSASDANTQPSTIDAASDTLGNLRLSDDGERPTTTANGALPNGNSVENKELADNSAASVSESHTEQLQAELEKTRQEKDSLATQYNNLLAKLQAMRTTLGNKLQQDAVCFPRLLALRLCM